MVTAVEQESVKAVEPVSRKIVVFLLLTFGSSSLFYYLMVAHGGIRKGGALFAFPLMWCPGTSALLTQLIFSRSLRGMGWGWGKTRYQLVSCFLPLAYAAVAYGVIWGTGLAPLSDSLIADKLGEQLASTGLKGLSRAQLLAIYLAVTLTLGVSAQLCRRARRRDWVARLPGAATGKSPELFADGVDQRADLVRVALSDSAFRRLHERGIADLVRSRVLYGDGAGA